jgi:CubicO group peptidase (beta-lactamase class C family)
MKKILGVFIALSWCLQASAVLGRTLDVDVSKLPAQMEIDGLDPATAQAVREIAGSMMVERHSPGLGVGVVAGETLVLAGYFGWQEVETGVPVSAETFFRIGSISKSITALGLLQLWEAGKFQLDDDINDYLPAPLFFPPRAEAGSATFRHLLTHTSGAGEFLSYSQAVRPGFGVMVKDDHYLPLANYLQPGFHNKVAPGEKWAYSNYGFALLGYALECMAGQPFNQYMKEHVFLPLGMSETTFEHTRDMLPRIAAGYAYQGKGQRYQRTEHQAFGITPAGNVYTTVPEFALYVSALLNAGRNQYGSVIKPETLAMMMAKQHTYDPRQMAYGFGLFHYGDDIWGTRVVGHSGSVPFGYTSMMLLAPEQRIGVFVFANSGANAPSETCWAILKAVLHAPDQPRPQLVRSDPAKWKDLVGLYGPGHPDFKTSTRLYMSGVGRYQVEIQEGELMLMSQWQGRKSALPLHQVAADDPYFFWFEDEDNPLVRGPRFLSFHRGSRGEVYLVPGGLEEFVKLDREREDKALVVLPLGRMLARINPF